MLARALSAPLDKASIWMATDNEKRYKNMLQASKGIVIEQGRLGLFKGTTVSAAFLGIYMLALNCGESRFKSVLFPKQLND